MNLESFGIGFCPLHNMNYPNELGCPKCIVGIKYDNPKEKVTNKLHTNRSANNNIHYYSVWNLQPLC